MDNLINDYYPVKMKTTGRHNQLVRAINAELYKWERSGEIFSFSEEVALGYKGEKAESVTNQLIKVADLSEIQIKAIRRATALAIDEVQPDYMMFSTNDFICNLTDTLYVGQPNLIVEVWSKSNSPEERNGKRSLYATGDNTEHWYLEQYQNDVECWLGTQKLPTQNLKDILKTVEGYELDLRHLAYPEEDKPEVKATNIFKL